MIRFLVGSHEVKRKPARHPMGVAREARFSVTFRKRVWHFRVSFLIGRAPLKAGQFQYRDLIVKTYFPEA